MLPETNTRQRAIKIFVAVVGCSLIIVVAYFLYGSYRTMQFKKHYQAALTSETAQNYELAISEEHLALQNARTSAQAGQVEIMLAHDLWVRNVGTDRSDAITLYKAIALDESFPDDARAVAYSSLAFTLDNFAFAWNLDSFPSASALAKQVVSTEPFKTYMADAHDDTSQVVLKLYATSNAVQPTAFAKLESARILANMLFNAGVNQSDASQVQDAQKLKDLADTGGSLLAIMPVQSEFFYRLHLDHAIAERVASEYFTDIPKDIVAAEFVRVITPEAASSSPAVAFGARLVYAAYLSDTATTTAEKAEIASLLSVFSNARNLSFIAPQMRSVAARPSDNPVRKEYAKLTEISSVFGDVAKSLNITF